MRREGSSAGASRYLNLIDLGDFVRSVFDARDFVSEIDRDGFGYGRIEFALGGDYNFVTFILVGDFDPVH
jgi:hypothetical protein